MAARYRKSRKRLGGKRRKPPKNFQVYLDENLQRCDAILSVLKSNSIVTHQHFRYFPKVGTEDSVWMPLVGDQNWILLTTDGRLRFNELERLTLIHYRMKVFQFSKNTQGGSAMAKALQIALPRIIRLSSSLRAPFVCKISPNGDTQLQWRPKRSEIRQAERIQWPDQKVRLRGKEAKAAKAAIPLSAEIR
jgi:PIN like domain